jgi:hypothetical protein
VVALILVGSPGAQELSFPEAKGLDELVKQDGSFKETWVRPDGALSRYSDLYLETPVFQFREVDSAKRTGSLITASDGMQERFQERFRKVFTAAFIEELESSERYQLADEPGSGALILRVSVLDIVSNAPPPSVHRVDSYYAQTGVGTIYLELIDSVTGVIQARAAERRRILAPDRQGYHLSDIRTNPAALWFDVERWAREAAADLCLVGEEKTEEE